ncbi:MAG: HAMP domain-containing protein, partial [Campylobacterales bacterium]
MKRMFATLCAAAALTGSAAAAEIEVTIVNMTGYSYFTPLLRRTFQSGNIEVFVYKDHYYYAYKMHDMYYYRSDEPMTPYKLYILSAFAVLLIAVVLLYRYMSGSIEPLQNLHRQIRRFANGEKGIDTKVEGSDEVAQVANAFHESVGKIEALQRSRSLFLRNVMHELKTPISKGKLLAH